MSTAAESRHCAECQIALDANRTGWCEQCKAFVAASECTCGPGKYTVDLQDLSCPGCGKRWCFGLEDVNPGRWG
jgi:hypothetical protein